MEKFANLKRVVIEELEKLNAEYANKSEFTEKDAETYKCLMHGLKCQLTAEAMMEADSYERGMSGARGRGMDGRYISRDMGPGWDDGMSGYYPRMTYPPDRGFYR